MPHLRSFLRYHELVRTTDFDYQLTPDLIAQTPIEPRDAARLLVLQRATEQIEHHIFRELPELLRPGDLLVMNDTRVLKARMRGRLIDSGGAVELLLLRDLGGGRWEAMARPGRRLRPGRRVLISGPSGESTEALIEARGEDGTRIVSFPPGVMPGELGDTPLPPYITAPLSDPERYQTVYAREAGSAAAPTAGLHFTNELLERLAGRGIGTAHITLHVGPGTFRPVNVDDPRTHDMHAEFFHLPISALRAMQQTRAAGGRIVAVGTTAVRTLEHAGTSVFTATEALSGWTKLLILPGYHWQVIDALVTNFHLPRSTLLMLVSALAGREFVLRAYQEAVTTRYRFYSFGDAMLVL